MNILEKISHGWRRIMMALVIIAPTGGWGTVSADGIKIGVVNTEKILRESLPALQAQKKIEQEFLLRDEDIKRIAMEAKVLQNKLEKGSTTLEEVEQRNLERKLANLSREYQRAQKQMREDLSLRQNEEYTAILDRTNRAISKIAEIEKYDLILQLQDSVYRSHRIDITDKVIKTIDNERN